MEAMSGEPPPTGAKVWRERLIAFAVLCFFVMLAACSGLLTVIELPLRLLLGWTWHLGQAVPELLPQWPKLLLPLACLALATWLVHRFIRWWLAAKGSAADWRARHTLSATTLVLLGVAAAIALSGVVHQAVWLADAPWWTNRGKFTIRTDATNKIRQLHLAIIDFENEHGRYPDSLAELKTNPTLLSQSPDLGEPPEPILYLKPREIPEHSDTDDGIAIFVSPFLGSERSQFVVGFSSGTTRILYRHQWAELLETRRKPTPKSHE